MKRTLFLIILGLAAWRGQAAEDVAKQLQTGLFEEEANQNLPAAIEAYQGVIRQLDEQRKLAATAVFRLGECYRKLGRTNDAAQQYQRVLREFSDQPSLKALSEQNLYALGAPLGPSSKPAASSRSSTDEEDREVRRIQALIKNSPDLINAPDMAGKSLLHQAAAAGQLQVATFLLDHKAALEGRDKLYGTPLFDAVEGGHKAMVELLLDRGADANVRNNRSLTPMHVAASRGFTAVMETLLANRADPKAKAMWEETPLHTAADGRQKQAAQLLLEHGADVNAMKSYDVSRHKPPEQRFGTPLHLGVLQQDPSMIKLLLEHGASVELKDPEGLTPLQVGARQGMTEAVGLLLTAKADPNSLVDKGELRDWTVLNLAVGMGRVNATVERLLKQGADPNLPNGPNARNYAGGRPLSLAIENGITSLVELLLENQADPNAEVLGNNPPLDLAVNRNLTGIVELLLNYGARIDTVTGGKPVLTVAVMLENLDMTKLLLSRGANPNLPSSDGSTPLHYIVEDSVSPRRSNIPGQNRNIPGQNEESIMRTLLEHKADPNIRNNAGLSPLNLLGVPAKPTTSHQQALAKLLRAHGALDERPELAPQPDVIRIWRQGRLEGTEIFRRSTNWNNQFTLVEALLEAYSFSRTVFAPAPGPSRTPPGIPPSPVRLFQTVSVDGFDWPDLSRLTVRRLGPNGTYNHMEVNLLGQSNTVDLTKNLPLEFGDVIEIPERSHALSDAPVGLTKDQVRQLSAGPPTKVVLEVGRQLTELSLPRGSQRYLRSMLHSDSGQKALRSTSDLGRILVHRRDPESKQSKEFLVNAYENREVSDDLLIENGDIIEVPDR